MYLPIPSARMELLPDFVNSIVGDKIIWIMTQNIGYAFIINHACAYNSNNYSIATKQITNTGVNRYRFAVKWVTGRSSGLVRVGPATQTQPPEQMRRLYL